MVHFQAALVLEQGVRFAVVGVNQNATATLANAENVSQGFQPYFPGVPVVLMSRDGRNRPYFVGRKDLVDWLAKVPAERLPWRKMTLSN